MDTETDPTPGTVAFTLVSFVCDPDDTEGEHPAIGVRLPDGTEEEWFFDSNGNPCGSDGVAESFMFGDAILVAISDAFPWRSGEMGGFVWQGEHPMVWPDFAAGEGWYGYN